MNRITPHIRAAVTYFRMGLVMVFFFSLAIALQAQAQPLLSRWLALTGVPAMLAFTHFCSIRASPMLRRRIRFQPLKPNAHAHGAWQSPSGPSS
jgi:hypothetical protein